MKDAQTPLKVLLIGCGGITNAHLPAFEKYPARLQLVAICDPSSFGRSTVSRRMAAHGPVVEFEDYKQAIAEMKHKVDAVLVTTPHFLHYPQACACMEAGLPVLVEKPVCNNLAETRELLALSRSTGTLVVAGQNRRYEPKALWMRERISARPDDFGELRTFDLHGWQNIEAWIATKEDPSADFWILDKERAGGGVVVSLLVHYIDMVRYLSGQDFIEATATGRFDQPFRNGAESSCSALLKMSGGATGTLHANYLARKVVGEGEAFNMIFDNGSISSRNGWEFATTAGTPADSWDFQYNGVEKILPGTEEGDSSFVRQMLAFAEAVRTGRQPMNTIAENFNTMATVEAIYESMNQGGRPVAVQQVV